jgi:hypothetical protein
MTRATLLAAVVAATGCSSLLADPCMPGFTYERGACVVAATGPDAGLPLGSAVDAGPGSDGSNDGSGSGSGSACTADTATDPDNCGACGVVCASGVCTDGMCAGTIDGHIVAIGHDYTSWDGAMAHVLADAVGLGHSADLRVALLAGTATAPSLAGTAMALASAMAPTGRAWNTSVASGPADLAGADVLLVAAQTGDDASALAEGMQWQTPLASFVANGGVVVVLEGDGGVSWRFAAGAGLYTFGPPTDATGELATIVAPTDATTIGVITPYLAESSSVAYQTTTGATITTPAGAIVVHLATP